VSGQLHAQAALSPGKEPPVPIGQEAGWAPEPVWTTWIGEKSFPYRDSNSDPSIVQPVASRCTDCAIPAPRLWTNRSREVIFRHYLEGAVGNTKNLSRDSQCSVEIRAEHLPNTSLHRHRYPNQLGELIVYNGTVMGGKVARVRIYLYTCPQDYAK
jgi:hypothetical protein